MRIIERVEEPGAATASTRSPGPSGASFWPVGRLSPQKYLTGVNAAAIRGLDHQLIALVWIVGFSAYFTEDILALGGERTLTCQTTAQYRMAP